MIAFVIWLAIPVIFIQSERIIDRLGRIADALEERNQSEEKQPAEEAK